MEGIATLERRKQEISAQIATEKQAFLNRTAELGRQYAEADTQLQLKLGGIDVAAIERAKQVISVSGDFLRAGDERCNARAAAIADLLKGGGDMFMRYHGTKTYAHWHGQQIECTYGMGPAHGTVIFRIELTRARRAAGTPLTEVEIDAAVFYLRNLEKVQAIEAQAGANAKAAA